VILVDPTAATAVAATGGCRLLNLLNRLDNRRLDNLTEEAKAGNS
jgi:hypothetical protein